MVNPQTPGIQQKVIDTSAKGQVKAADFFKYV